MKGVSEMAQAREYRVSIAQGPLSGSQLNETFGNEGWELTTIVKWPTVTVVDRQELERLKKKLSPTKDNITKKEAKWLIEQIEREVSLWHYFQKAKVGEPAKVVELVPTVNSPGDDLGTGSDDVEVNKE